MSSGDVDMRAFIEQLRGLSRLPEEAAKVGAPLIEDAARTIASGGTDPAGNTWKAKKDGSKPLIHAAKALKGTAIATVIQLQLSFPETIHNRGTGRIPKRQILPDAATGKLPRTFLEALSEAASKAFQKVMG